jgi:hypothetical protein
MRTRVLAAALLVSGLLASGCGGSDDPLPAGGGEPPQPSVEITSVTPAGADPLAGADDVLYVTRNATVTVGGMAPAGAEVEALSDEDGLVVGRDVAGDDGTFVFTLPARERVLAYDVRARLPGRGAGPPQTIRLLRRVTAPAPFTVDDVASPLNDEIVNVTGATERDTTVVVRVEGGTGPVEVRKPTGTTRFELSVPLARDRTHRLSIVATDLAGNRTSAVVREVVQDSTAPPLPQIDESAASGSRATLTGRAPQAARVELTTPADGLVTVTVAPDGHFSAPVTLPRDGENAFSAVAIDAAGNRSEARQGVLTRDSVAPAPPSELSVRNQLRRDGQTWIILGETAQIRGRAEPGATVEASTTGVFGTTRAGDDGSFTVNARLPNFSTHVIRVEAVDRAGNRSPAATIAVRRFRLWGF